MRFVTAVICTYDSVVNYSMESNGQAYSLGDCRSGVVQWNALAKYGAP